MKKIISLILLLAAIMPLSACGGESITMQDVYDAHQLETVLANNENVHIRVLGEGQLYIENYITADLSYENLGSWAMYMTDNSCYLYQNDAYHRVVYIDADGLLDMAGYRAERYGSTLLVPATLEEDIKSVTKADNHITVTSTMSEENVKTLDETMVSGEFEYLLNAKSLKPVGSKAHYTYDDGSVYNEEIVFEYDVEMPEGIKPFLEIEQQTEDLRTVTIVFNSGTEKESTAIVQAPKGMVVGIATKSGGIGEYEIYTDPNFTQSYVPGDYTSDTTIYIKWLG